MYRSKAPSPIRTDITYREHGPIFEYQIERSKSYFVHVKNARSIIPYNQHDMEDESRTVNLCIQHEKNVDFTLLGQFSSTIIEYLAFEQEAHELRLNQAFYKLRIKEQKKRKQERGGDRIYSLYHCSKSVPSAKRPFLYDQPHLVKRVRT